MPTAKIQDNTHSHTWQLVIKVGSLKFDPHIHNLVLKRKLMALFRCYQHLHYKPAKHLQVKQMCKNAPAPTALFWRLLRCTELQTKHTKSKSDSQSKSKISLSLETSSKQMCTVQPHYNAIGWPKIGSLYSLLITNVRLLHCDSNEMFSVSFANLHPL